MVTHELTVFPDGRVDGAVCVREGDYKSHTLHFVFAEGLRAASAKLMVWAAGAEKPTVYDTAKGDGSCTELDAAFTPVLWQSVGRTRLQLELLGSDGSIIWQSRRFTAAVEEGVPGEAQPPGADTSDATAQPEDVVSGKVFYGADGRQVGTNLLAAVCPVAEKDAAAIVNTLQFPNWGNTYAYYTQAVGADTKRYLLFPYTPGIVDDNKTMMFDSVLCIRIGMLWSRAFKSTIMLDGMEIEGEMQTQTMYGLTIAQLLSVAETHELILPGRNGKDYTFTIIPYDVTKTQ